MKMNKIIWMVLVPFILSGCNSAMYDIVEIEEPVNEPVTKQTDTPVVTELETPEIKQDETPEIKPSDTKFSNKIEPSKTYTVQIGAFRNESNAVNFLNSAKRYVGDGLYYEKSDGMYKVRVGTFSDIPNARGYNESLQGNGFPDSFVVEIIKETH